MKKFGDLLRLLSSILLGFAVREFDQMYKSIDSFLRRDPYFAYFDWLPRLLAILVFALFIRNIHSSARYDEWLEENGYTPDFERSTLGRFVVMLMYVAGLFLGPFYTVHVFAEHADEFAGIKTQAIAGMYVPFTPLLALFVALFLPVFVYVFWDVLLWLSRPPSRRVKVEPPLPILAHRWLMMDAITILVFLTLLGHSLYLYGKKPSESPSRVEVALTGAVLVVFILVWDYGKNRDFYFPSGVRVRYRATRTGPHVSRPRLAAARLSDHTRFARFKRRLLGLLGR